VKDLGASESFGWVLTFNVELCARLAVIEEDMEEDVGVFIPKMLEATLGRLGARYEGLLSIEVILPAT
jgi:hypothetical protein